MAHDKKEIIIKPGRWTPSVAAFIDSALSTATLADIKGQVKQGAALFAVMHKNKTVAAFVLRVDHLVGRSEGVIVAAGGKLHGVNLIAAIVPVIEGMFQGCQSIRAHTENPAVARLFARLGYTVSEIILTKDLHG